MRGPPNGVDNFGNQIGKDHPAGNFGQKINDIVFNQFFAGHGLGDLGNKNGKAGAEGRRRPGEQKKSPGPDQHAFAKAEGTAKHNAGHPTQRALVKEGQKGTGGGKHGHDLMHVVTQVMKKRYLVEFAVFQHHGNIFNGQHDEIGGQTEGHFGQHGMNIGMPEDKPSPQGLADIKTQDHQGRTVADEPDEHGIIDNIFEFVFTDQIA